MPSACLLIAGLWAAPQCELPFPTSWWLIGSALALLCAWLMPSAVPWAQSVRRLLAGLVMVALGLGLGHRAWHPQFSTDHIRTQLAIPRTMLCDGVVAARPEQFSTGARVRVALRACRARRAVVADEKMRSVRGVVQLSADRLPSPLLAGARVRFQASLRLPAEYWNPGTMAIGLRPRAEGIDAVGWLPEAQWLRVLAPSTSVFARAAEAWRVATVAGWRAQGADADERGMLQAMVLGHGEALEADRWEQFRRVGIIHLLVVSGLHVGMVALVLLAGARWLCTRSAWLALRLPVWRVAAAVAIGGTWAYTFMTGANIPAVRAAWMVTLLLGAQLLDRRRDTWSALALAAMVILVLQPLALWLPTFQLTFAAVIAILGLAIIWPPAEEQLLWWRRAVRWCAQLAAVSLAATLGTAPIVAWHFQSVSLVGLVANLLFVPWVSLLMVPLGFLQMLLAWWALAAAPIATVLVGLARWMLAAVAWFDRSGPAWQWHWTPDGAALITWYAVMGLGVALCTRAIWPQRARRWTLAGCGVLALVSVLVAGGSRLGWGDGSAKLRVHFVDVGQGLAMIVRFPNHRVYVIDGGGIAGSRFDMGERVMAPVLRRLGIARVDVLMLTHYHPDHFGGLGYLAEQFAPEVLYVNGSEATEWQPAEARTALPPFEQRIAATGVRQVVRNTATLPWNEGGVAIRVLHPSTDLQGLHENDRSLVLELTHGEVRLLLAGDIERRAESRLVDAGVLQNADLVQVPHHGSDTSSTAPWVAAVHPRHAVIACGRHNRYRFPHRSVLATYAQSGTQVWRTDRHGMVTAESDGKTLTVTPLVQPPDPAVPTPPRAIRSVRVVPPPPARAQSPRDRAPGRQ